MRLCVSLPCSDVAHTVALHEPPRGYGVRGHDPRPGLLPARGHVAPAMSGAGRPGARPCDYGGAGPLLRPVRRGAGRAWSRGAHLRLPRHRRLPAAKAARFRRADARLDRSRRRGGHGMGADSLPRPAAARGWPQPRRIRYRPVRLSTAAGTSRAPRWSARRWRGSATSRAPPNARASTACSR